MALCNKTVVELKDLARKRNLKGFSTLDKAGLVRLLKKYPVALPADSKPVVKASRMVAVKPAAAKPAAKKVAAKPAAKKVAKK